MLFRAPKQDGSTRLSLNLSEEKCLGASKNENLDINLCTMESAQTKQVVKTLKAVGKGALPCAKDLQVGCCNVSVQESGAYDLRIQLHSRTSFFVRLPKRLS